MAINFGRTLPITIPQLSDQANIVTALTQLYYGTLDGSTATENDLYTSTYSIAGNLQRLFTDKVNKAGNMTQFQQTTTASDFRGLISGTSGTGNLLFASSPSISSPSISGGITLSGSTSGSLIIKAAATAGTGVNITFPATTGNVVTTGDSSTVTNTMLAGSIENAKLVNSKVTIGTTDISLGGSATTLSGLTAVSSTLFTGALNGNATTATKIATGVTINGTTGVDWSLPSYTFSAAANTLTGSTLASNVTGSSLTSVGTIATGVWNATPIAYAKVSLTGSIVNNDIANNAGIAVSKLANGTTGFILRAGSTGPEWVDTATVPVSSASKLVNAVTFNSSGNGALSPQSFDGSATLTVSHNTIGAAALGHTHGNITTDGKIGSTADLIVKTTTAGALTTLTAGTTSQYLRGDGTWGIPAGTYSLPIAGTGSGGTLGGIKVGSNLSIDGSGVLSATAYSLPTATVGTSTTGTLGGVKVDGTTVTISNGVISASPPLSAATSTDLGGIKLISDTAMTTSAVVPSGTGTTGKVYAVQLNSSNQAVVSVPWTGTVTSVGVAVPAELTASSAITSSGTITIGYATGRSIPLTTDTAKGVTAYGWGDHSQAGYLTTSGTMYLGTTSIAFNRSSGAQTINGLNIDGNAGSATKSVAYSATSTYPTTPTSRIYVGASAPTTGLNVGDIWMW